MKPLGAVLIGMLFFMLAGQLEAASPWKVSAREAEVALPSGASWLKFTVSGEEEVDLQVVRFSARQCTLRVVDQPSRAEAETLEKTMKSIGAIAGVNGGFFSPTFEPLGLVISDGRRAGAWQKSSLLGGVVVVRKDRLMLLWRDEFKDNADIRELLQAGPRLVNHGTAVTSLEAGRRRPRTFIATDNSGRWLIGIAQSTSLAHLAQILAIPGMVPGVEIDRALNFDGGRSSGLWLRTAAGTGAYEEEISTVRNFVAVMPRGSTYADASQCLAMKASSRSGGVELQTSPQSRQADASTASSVPPKAVMAKNRRPAGRKTTMPFPVGEVTEPEVTR